MDTTYFKLYFWYFTEILINNELYKIFLNCISDIYHKVF